MRVVHPRRQSKRPSRCVEATPTYYCISTHFPPFQAVIVISQQISGCVRLIALSGGDRAQRDQLVDLIDSLLVTITRFKNALR